MKVILGTKWDKSEDEKYLLILDKAVAGDLIKHIHSRESHEIIDTEVKHFKDYIIKYDMKEVM